MTNDQLELAIRSLIAEERRITTELLPLINLAEDRKLYLERGFPSLHDWLVKGLGYSESAAYRRISAARLLRAVPSVSQKIESGQVNLSTLAKAQAAIRSVEKLKGERLSAELKTEIVQNIENKSSLESERTLFSMFPELNSNVSAECVTVLNDETSRVASNFSNETLAKIDRIKELMSHTNPNADFNEIVDKLADYFLKHEDPLLKTGKKSPHSNSAAVSPRPKSWNGKRVFLMRRSHGCCEYKDPKTGKVCGSRHQIQIDHIKPRAFGGSDEIENLRCLCRKHNLMMAERNLGIEKANRWRLKSQNQNLIGHSTS